MVLCRNVGWGEVAVMAGHGFTIDGIRGRRVFVTITGIGWSDINDEQALTSAGRMALSCT